MTRPGHNFAQPRKIDESLTTLHPRVTYLEWLRAIDVGENMEINNRAITFIQIVPIV